MPSSSTRLHALSMKADAPLRPGTLPHAQEEEHSGALKKERDYLINFAQEPWYLSGE